MCLDAVALRVESRQTQLREFGAGESGDGGEVGHVRLDGLVRNRRGGRLGAQVGERVLGTA